jgi:nucleoside-diphosphate-sugar epimerase
VGDVVLVTGATGFIGRHVIAALTSHNRTVRAFVRNQQHNRHNQHDNPHPDLPCDVATGSFDDPDSIRQALRDVATVIHLAGFAHAFGTGAHKSSHDPRYAQINADATRTLAQHAAGAGVKTFLLMSSVAAVASAADEPITESTLPAPDNDYGRSKLLAEQYLLESATSFGAAPADAPGDARRDMQTNPMRPIVLRPPMVYGPGMKGNPLRLLRHLRRGIPFPVPRGDVRRSVLYVGNLVGAVTALTDTPGARGVFMIHDGPAPTVEEFVRLFASGSPAERRIVPLPAGLLCRGAVFLEAVGLARLATPAKRLTGSLVVDDTHFRRTTGTKLPFSTEEGIRRTLSAYEPTSSV